MWPSEQLPNHFKKEEVPAKRDFAKSAQQVDNSLPMHPGVVDADVREVERGGQHGLPDKACDMPHVPAFICHSSVGSRIRHPNGAGAFGPQCREDDDDLYSCA
jgi:hypothetical protein